MTARIHPTAIIDAGAELAADVEVGPFAIIGPHCTVGAGSVIGAHAVLEEFVRLGEQVDPRGRFGFRISGFFRISDFGFRISTGMPSSSDYWRGRFLRGRFRS